jgi:hypothetical protein
MPATRPPHTRGLYLPNRHIQSAPALSARSTPTDQHQPATTFTCRVPQQTWPYIPHQSIIPSDTCITFHVASGLAFSGARDRHCKPDTRPAAASTFPQRPLSQARREQAVPADHRPRSNSITRLPPAALQHSRAHHSNLPPPHAPDLNDSLRHPSQPS